VGTTPAGAILNTTPSLPAIPGRLDSERLFLSPFDVSGGQRPWPGDREQRLL